VPLPASSTSIIARWAKNWPGAAPCQCQVSGGIVTVSPGSRICGSEPLKQMRPIPAVQ
jgi:hypothetical protein